MGRFQESNGRLGEPSLPCKWQGCLSEATVVLTARSSNSLMEMVSGSRSPGGSPSPRVSRRRLARTILTSRFGSVSFCGSRSENVGQASRLDEFLVSFLVAAKVALVNQPDAIGPVQRAASQIAAQRSTISYEELMPNLSKATSGTPRPKETTSASPSHVSNSICEELKKDPVFCTGCEKFGLSIGIVGWGQS